MGCYLGESQIAGGLAAVQDEHPDVDVGSYPFYRKDGFGTNLVIRGTDESELEPIVEKLKVLIVDEGGEPQDPIG